MNLNNKKVVITGGSIGIGLQLAKQIIAEGGEVLVCARNLKALETARQQTPGLHIVQCDITDPEQVRLLLAQTKTRLGGVDILINNAAVFRRFNILEPYPLEQQLQEIDINFKGTVQVTNIFLDELLKSKSPTIVNLTSALGFIPMTSAQIYSATKAAINSWTISLRHQLRSTPAKVVLVCPPVVDTRMNVNNPGTEGMKKISAAKFAELVLKGLKRDKSEIFVGQMSSFKVLSRWMPRLAFRVINKA